MDGAVLRAWRRSRGWDAPELARRMRKAAGGAPLPEPDNLKRMIWRWEREGLRTERYVLLYAKVFGVSPDALVDGPLRMIGTGQGSQDGAGRGSRAALLEGQPEDSESRPQPRFHSLGFGIAVPDVQPILRNMTRVSALPAVSAIREVQQGYLAADRMMGALSVTGAIRTQIPIVETACEVTRGADRAHVLEFACRFFEFCGWVHQDAGDLSAAIFWTDRAFDYAMELGERRTIAYTLMRKSSIATEAGNPAQGLGIANFALSDPAVLTPRLRGVILRQRAHAYAALHELKDVERDADQALAEAAEGASQQEEDRAPYCSPMYVAMEAGQSMVVAGRPGDGLSVLAKSRLEWSDLSQVRDYALCVSRLATAYAAAGDPERARATAEEALSLACGIGSRRVIGQLAELLIMLGRWQNDPALSATKGKIRTLVASFQAA